MIRLELGPWAVSGLKEISANRTTNKGNSWSHIANSQKKTRLKGEIGMFGRYAQGKPVGRNSTLYLGICVARFDIDALIKPTIDCIQSIVFANKNDNSIRTLIVSLSRPTKCPESITVIAAELNEFDLLIKEIYGSPIQPE